MPTINIKVKPANDSVLEFDIDPETTKVSDLKELISQKHKDAEPGKQRLIYSGRILKSTDDNNKLLSEYNVKDGNTIHLVVSKKEPAAAGTSGATTATASAQSQTTPQQQQQRPAFGGAGFDPFFGAGNLLNPGSGLGSMPPPNPEYMEQVFDNPMFQQMMQQLSSNPELFRSMMESHPMFSSLPEQQRELMLNPDMLRLLTNPDMMRSIARLQANMGRSGEVPPPVSTAPPASDAGGQQQQQSAPAFDPTALQSMLSSLGGFPGAGGNLGVSPQPPAQQLTIEEQREMYREQLMQLNDMGFFDEVQNLRALTATNGNVSAAVDYLLSHPY